MARQNRWQTLRPGVEPAAGLSERDESAVRPLGSHGGHSFFGPRYPPLNVWEEGDAAYVEAELPGQDLKQYVIGNQATA